jgi:hypothetical protein
VKEDNEKLAYTLDMEEAVIIYAYLTAHSLYNLNRLLASSSGKFVQHKNCLGVMQIAFQHDAPGKLFSKEVCWLHVPDRCLCTTCI